jgi:hypothetical protein
MTYLFTYVGDTESDLPDLRDRLPSLARLPEQKRSLIRLDRIRGPIRRFTPQFEEAGVSDLPNVDDLEHKLKAGSLREEIREGLCDLHYILMRAFSTTDNRFAKAYRLGRSLATTCHIADSQVALEKEFDPYRLARLDEWLADLASQVPPHSSRPVRLSLSVWRDWVADPVIKKSEVDPSTENAGLRARGRRQLGQRHRRLEWDKDGVAVRQALRRQGDIWRALLSGEKRGDAMLELPDFIDAAVKIPQRTFRLLSTMVLPMVVFTTITCVGVFFALEDDGLGKAVAGVVAIVVGLTGGVGFTWQGPLDSLRRSAAELKQPLWGAVLDEEIAKAITERPRGAMFTPEDAAIAAPAAGPHAGLEWAT